MIEMFDSSLSIGGNKERMRRKSHAVYQNFVDDDDFVAPNYVSSILPWLSCNSYDYIGFKVQCYHDGRKLPPTYHSTRYDGWTSDEHGYYRDISHINPMRRSVALLEAMEGGYGEDFRWATRMRGKVKSERFLEKTLYFYLQRSKPDDAVDFKDPFRVRLMEEIWLHLRDFK